ncbi:MAG: hypothetical protein IKJ36_04425 [Clostridia bacterium]|nr:hypothetical protein [Clostridia bacterium]
MKDFYDIYVYDSIISYLGNNKINGIKVELMEEEINEQVRYDCINRWENDEKSENFNQKYNEWIKTIPLENRELIYKLLEKFNYYGHVSVNTYFKKLYLNIVEKYNIDNNETMYTFIKKNDSSFNSSMGYAYEFMRINKISAKNSVLELRDLKSKEIEQIKNIVLIDDYSGSGNSIIKYIKKYNDIFSEKNVYILLVSMSENADRHIIEELKEYKINIIFEVMNIEKKAFSDVNFCKEEISRRKEEFELISRAKKIPNYIFGRYNTEALISFYNNTPNNTLNLFWEKTSQNDPLFPRDINSSPDWRMIKKEKENRKLQNLNNTKILVKSVNKDG